MIDTTPIPKFLQQEFECSLCLTFLTNPITIPCGHTFCKECISNAVKQIPRCPTCRGTITIEIKNLKENLLIKSTVNELKKHLSIADNPQKQQIENKEENNQQSENQSSCIQKKLLHHINIKELFQKRDNSKVSQKLRINQIDIQQHQKFVITFQSKQNQDIGYLAQLQLVQIIDGQITAQILTEDIVELSNKEQTEFQLNNDGQIKYFLPIATAKILQEDYIDLNDNDTSYQISTLIQQIKDVLLPFIQQLSNGQSGLSLYLHQSGLVMYLNLQIEKDWKSLKRLSFLLPSLLNIDRSQKQYSVLKQLYIEINFDQQKHSKIQKDLRSYAGIYDEQKIHCKKPFGVDFVDINSNIACVLNIIMVIQVYVSFQIYNIKSFLQNFYLKTLIQIYIQEIAKSQLK